MAASRGDGAGGRAKVLAATPEQVLVCSTGVIGMPLPVERIRKAVPALIKATARTAAAFDGFTRAIMTTDTRPEMGGRALPAWRQNRALARLRQRARA